MTNIPPIGLQCEVCKVNFVASVVERVRDGNDIEFGIECPKCKTWQHAYFFTPDLKELLGKLHEIEKLYALRPSPHRKAQAGSAKRMYQTQFRKVNALLRTKYGIARALPPPVNL